MDAEDSGQEHSLHLASREGQLDVVRLLLDKGARLDAESEEKFKYTPLHLASGSGHLESSASSSTRARGWTRRTCQGHRPHGVCLRPPRGRHLLVDAGADLHAKNIGGLTPRDVAQQHGNHTAVVAALEAVTTPKEERRRVWEAGRPHTLILREYNLELSV